MRPIDADVLIPLIQEDKIEGEALNIVKALGDGLQAETLNQTCDRHIKIINNLPTVEQKHGEWHKFDSTYYRCSNCGGWLEYGSRSPEYLKIDYKYCPKCGARMDE